MDKRKILSLLISRLEDDLVMTKQAAQATYDAATNEESKPENEYDTRALEASYLAGAQAQRAAEIDRALSFCRNVQIKDFSSDDPIAATALVTLSLNDKTSVVFLLPLGGGTAVDYEGRAIKVVTPASNLGQALLGLTRGDVAEVKADRKSLEYEVLEVT